MALKKGKEVTDRSVATLKKFQSGKLEPIRTGKKHLDDALLGGLLPSTVLGICARSGHGKTYDLEQIERYIQKNYSDVIMLKCAWEMEHFKLLVRDLVNQTGKNVKDVLFKKVENNEEIQKFKEICDSHRSENIYWQDEPVSHEDFEADVEELIQKYPHKKIVVSIDNLENVLNGGDQKGSMDRLLYKINKLKKVHPFICFIILNQLNGNYLSRKDDVKSHRPIDTDIYGTEQLLKLCDVLYIKMLPWKFGIVDKFMVFGRTQYDWLNDHKLPPSTTNSKTTSFDPFGRAFYFYLKLRMPEDEKRLKDVHIDVLFTKEEAGFVEPEPEAEDTTPFFGKPDLPVLEVGLNHTLHKSKSKGKGFESEPAQDKSEDEPF